MRTPTADLDALLANTSPLLSVKQSAAIAGCHPKTLQRACRRGTLEAVKPGKDYRIPRAALRRWLEKGVS